MDDLEQRLADLSAKATQGVWEHEFTPGETSGGEININGEFALLVAGGNHALWRDTECGGDTEFQANGDLAVTLVNAYRAGELIPASTLAAKDARIAELESQNASLRHWSVGHIDALLLYAAGTYPNDSHVREAVEFCRIVAPGKKLRMDPLNGSDFHPARESLRPTRATGADHD